MWIQAPKIYALIVFGKLLFGTLVLLWISFYRISPPGGWALEMHFQ